MTLKDRRGLDLRVALVKMVLGGVLPEVIVRDHGVPRATVWRHLAVAEREGVIARVPGTRRPVLFRPGANASALMSGWPTKPVLVPDSGGGPEARRPKGACRVHAVSFRVQVLHRPEAPAADLPWQRCRKWGNVEQLRCYLSIDGIGTVKLRLLANAKPNQLVMFTPYFYADRETMAKFLDAVSLRSQAILIHLNRTYGYRFGTIRLHQQPEYAFPVDDAGIKTLLAKYKPRTAKWWADASPESGGAEIETRDYEEAMKKLEEPARLARLEAVIGKHGEAIRSLQRTTLEQAKNQDRVLRLMETLTRQVGELKDIGELQGARTTYLLKELADRLNKRSEGPKET